MEKNLEAEKIKLFEMHPDWQSDDPVTKDMSNSTGWNIDYLAKQYIAQVKHRPFADNYEELVDNRNEWVEKWKTLSPSMTVQSALTDMAGTSSRYYRSYLRQTQEYAKIYREYVFKRVFTNHHFSSEEIEQLPDFQFNPNQVKRTIGIDLGILTGYLFILIIFCIQLSKQTLKTK